MQALRDAIPHLATHLNTPKPANSQLKTEQHPPNATPATSPLVTSPLLTSKLIASPLIAEQDPATVELAPRVALLFGSEKTGLTNEQLSHCSLLLTIPLFSPEGRHLSMNLGQSVAVCLYELSREGFEGVRELPVQNNTPATSADRERLTALLQEVMDTSGYARRFPANARLEVVRQLTGHLAQTREEASTWMGLFKHLQRPKRPDPVQE